VEYNSEVFCKQYPIIKECCFHYLAYKSLHTLYTKHNFESEFWRLTIDAHLLQAIINWSKIFGSDSSNRTHWKELETGDHSLIDDFRGNLLIWLKLSSPEWDEYWQKLQAFRNKYAAHTDSFNQPIPNLEIMYQSLLFFDDWIRKVSKDIFEAPPLEESCLMFTKRIHNFTKQLLLTTEEMKKTEIIDKLI